MAGVVQITHLTFRKSTFIVLMIFVVHLVKFSFEGVLCSCKSCSVLGSLGGVIRYLLVIPKYLEVQIVPIAVVWINLNLWHDNILGGLLWVRVFTHHYDTILTDTSCQYFPILVLKSSDSLVAY